MTTLSPGNRLIANVSLWRKHWVLCNIGYPSETHLKLKSREISFVHNINLNDPIVLKCCTESLPCPVQKFKTIGRLKQMLWTNKTSQALSLRWVSDWHPILHSTCCRCGLRQRTQTGWPWASCQIRKIADAHAPGVSGTFSPATAGKRSRHASRHVRHARAVMHAGVDN